MWEIGSGVKYEYSSAKVSTPISSSTSLTYAAIPTLCFIYYINIFVFLYIEMCVSDCHMDLWPNGETDRHNDNAR